MNCLPPSFPKARIAVANQLYSLLGRPICPFQRGLSKSSYCFGAVLRHGGKTTESVTKKEQRNEARSISNLSLRAENHGDYRSMAVNRSSTASSNGMNPCSCACWTNFLGIARLDAELFILISRWR